MKQKLLTIWQCLILAKMFLVEIYKESVRELEDKRAYPQSNYNSCLDRAIDIVKTACEKVVIFYGYSIAVHRQNFHFENRYDEIEALGHSLTTKQKKVAGRGFWLG